MVNSRLRRVMRDRRCPACGAGLQPSLRQKHDPFWIMLLIFIGAVSAFSLVGIPVMIIGLSLLRPRRTTWICDACSPQS